MAPKWIPEDGEEHLNVDGGNALVLCKHARVYRLERFDWPGGLKEKFSVDVYFHLV